MKADQLLRLERNWEERRMELLRELRRPCNVCLSEKQGLISPFLKDIFAERRVLIRL